MPATNDPWSDSLNAQRVEPLLRGRFGRPYLYRTQCESTQLLLDAESSEGAVAVCDHQLAGRGRLDRSWQAPAGVAILCSVLLRPPEGRRFPELTLVAGLAAAEVVEAATDVSTELKWPNDVIVDGRKVAGILAQVIDGSVVLGIGLNVNQEAHELPAAEQTRVPPGSLYTVDSRARDRAPLLADLLFSLERQYDTWREHELASLIPFVQVRDFLRGKRVAVDGEVGEAVGITSRGQLEVRISETSHLVESGEVELVP